MKIPHLLLATLLSCSSCSAEATKEKALSTAIPSYSTQDVAPIFFTKEYLDNEYLTYSAFWYGNLTDDHETKQPEDFEKFQDSLSSIEFSRECDKINVFRGSGSPYYQIKWRNWSKTISNARIYCYPIHEENVESVLRSINYSEQRVNKRYDRPIGNVELLDLFNCKVYDYSLINRQFVNLKILALPYSGCDFEVENMVLPQSVEALIVYNSALGEGFFGEISKLKNLKRLILYSCNIIDHDRYKFGKGVLPVGSYLSARDKYLTKLRERLSTLELYDSGDIERFFCIGNNWEKLTDLTISRSWQGSMPLDFLANYKFEDFERNIRTVTVNDEFPRLEKLTFCGKFGVPVTTLPKKLAIYLRTASEDLEVEFISYEKTKVATARTKSEPGAGGNG